MLADIEQKTEQIRFTNCTLEQLPSCQAIMQFREHIADRQAAEAVRARIDWKYLLGLALTDPGFDFSVLSEFRDRLLTGSAEERLLDKLLEGCQRQGLIKARGRQRTDSTHVLASSRLLSRIELVAETLRAALNELATVAPDWLRAFAPLEWFDRGSVAKFAQGAMKGQVASVWEEITRRGSRTVRPQCGPRLRPPPSSVVS